MALIRPHGILEVDAIPTHTPTSENAKLARLQNTLTFYYWNGTIWVATILGSQDGNNVPISRANTTENVAPTVGEIASPIAGDTADILLTSGKLEKWLHNGTAWSKAFVVDYKASVKPPAYASRALATTALGAGKPFIYVAANLDGAVEGTQAWT